MAVKSEQVEKNLVKLTFEISREELEKGISEAYKKNAKKISIPGFRKGKVPKAMIEQYYGEEVFYDDAINFVLPEIYDAAVKEAGVDPVARPEIDIEEIKKGEPIVVTALVTTKPEVKLGKYKSIKIDKIEYTVSEEDIAAEFEAMAKQYELEVEKIKTMVPMEEIKASLETRKAVKVIVDNAVAVKPE